MLTVAGRAAAKHCHRGSDGWFGDAGTGSAPSRNARAAAIVARILARAVWWNTHLGAFEHWEAADGHVAHARALVLELRVAEGYGARWAIGPEGRPRFRGFLEPHSEDGHAAGWKH